MGGKTVCGHNIKTSAGQKHHTGGCGLAIARSHSFDNRDRAGDIQIVNSSPQASIHHRPGGVNERACTVQNHANISEIGIDLSRILKLKMRCGRFRPFASTITWVGLRPARIGVMPNCAA